MSQQTSVASGAALPARPRATDTRSNFGTWGWTVVLIEGLMLWISAGAQVHGLNIIVPVLSGHFGIDPKTLLFWATPASWGSVVAGYVCAKMCEKLSTKTTIIICLVICGLCFGLLGTWGSVAAFVALFCGVCFFGSGYAYVGGTTLIANWFPQKKALAFGWVTMGQTFSTAVFVPMLAWMFATFGVQFGFWGMSIGMFVLAVLVGLFISNTPEERGCTPDNIPMTAEELARSKAEQEAYVCPYSTAQILAMKDTWLIGIASGGIYVVLVGVLSQMVPRLMALGMTLDVAILHLVVAALIGVPGAYVWGFIGTKMSPKSGLILYAGWWLVAVILNMFELNGFTLYASLGMIGLSFGGATNLTTSIVAEKFPRGAFITAFGVIQPIQGVIRCCAFAILAFGLTYLGGYVGAYALLACIAVVNMLMFWKVDTTPMT